MEVRPRRLNLDVDKINGKSNKGFLIIIGLIIMALAVGGVIAYMTSYKGSSDNSTANNQTFTSTPSVTSTVKPSTTVSTTVAITNTVVPTQTISPTTNVTLTPQPNITSTPVTTPTRVSDAILAFSIEVPAGWTSGSSEDSKELNCADYTSLFKTTCSGKFKVYSFNVQSSESNSNGNKYGISITSGNMIGSYASCTSDEKETSFFITINNVKYDIPSCTKFGTGEQRGFISNFPVTGSKSNWKTTQLTYTSKDRTMTEQILDALVTLY
ncbi:MAG: hypothetical protein WCJ19_05615 [bacterium]